MPRIPCAAVRVSRVRGTRSTGCCSSAASPRTRATSAACPSRACGFTSSGTTTWTPRTNTCRSKSGPTILVPTSCCADFASRATSWSRFEPRAMATDRARLLLRGASIALLTLTALPAAADSMRCGSKLVAEEDSIEKVLYLCGEPASKYRTWIVRQPRYYVGSNEYAFPGEEDVPVDLWTYDLGPNKLMMRLRFVAGRLESIETLGYGSSAGSKRPASQRRICSSSTGSGNEPPASTCV